MNIKKIAKEEKAFTFIELLVTLIVLSVAVLSVIAVSAKSYTSISLQRNKLIAINLAREGIEYVRYVRNKNWLYKGSSDCNMEYGTSSCTDTGQTAEDNGDCDWRCGDEENDTTSYKPQFRLGAFGKDGKWLADIENINPSTGALTISTISERIFNESQLIALESPDKYKERQEVLENACAPRIGTDTDKDMIHYPFARLIVITRGFEKDGVKYYDLNGDDNIDNDLLVEVVVCWKERGKIYSVSSEEHLFNWYRPQQ